MKRVTVFAVVIALTTSFACQKQPVLTAKQASSLKAQAPNQQKESDRKRELLGKWDMVYYGENLDDAQQSNMVLNPKITYVFTDNLYHVEINDIRNENTVKIWDITEDNVITLTSIDSSNVQSKHVPIVMLDADFLLTSHPIKSFVDETIDTGRIGYFKFKKRP